MNALEAYQGLLLLAHGRMQEAVGLISAGETGKAGELLQGVIIALDRVRFLEEWRDWPAADGPCPENPLTNET